MKKYKKKGKKRKENIQCLLPFEYINRPKVYGTFNFLTLHRISQKLLDMNYPKI